MADEEDEPTLVERIRALGLHVVFYLTPKGTKW